jgi:hypothetical protein
MSPPAEPPAGSSPSIRSDLAARIPEVRPQGGEPPAETHTPQPPVAAGAVASAGVEHDLGQDPDDGSQARPAEASPAGHSAVGALSTVTVAGLDHDLALSGDRLVIGRLDECDIHLQDANVSREHAALVSDGAGWTLEDLGSTNGTLLNGQPISRARLVDGDVIQLGVSELIYHEPRV